MFRIKMLAQPLSKPENPKHPRMSLCDGRPFASSPFCRVAGRGPASSVGAFLWWLLQVAFYLCSLLVPECDVGQADEDGHHSLDVAVWLGPYNTLLTIFEFCEEPTLCCEKEGPCSAVSCPPGESANIAWPSVQNLAHVRVRFLSLHADANEHVANEDPLRSVPHR